MTPSLGWAVLGTAGIARSAFLPALAEAGGRAIVVGGRDGQRARAFASAHGVEAGVEGYQAALEHPGVDAVYVALPNSLHAEWTAAALAAGKAVLCEKPLSTSVAECQSVLARARVGATAGGPAATGPPLLWEAFVFPYQAQFARVATLVADGAVGELREVVSGFHFPLSRAADIRLRPDLGGGCLADVGCYPLRLAQLLFGAAPTRAAGSAVWQHGAAAQDGVEVDAAALLDYPGGRRLLLTCGFRRAYDTTTRLLGTEGTIELANPFHPTPADTLVLRRPGHEPVVERPTTDAKSFTAALRHVAAVVADGEPPRHLAVEDSLATAQALADVTAACAP